MTYQQAGRIAILKRVVGWVIFIPALLSTLISVLKFMYAHSEKQEDKCGNAGFYPRNDRHDAREYAVSECFWYNSPTPNFQGSLNIGFWLIFILILSGWRCRIPAPE